MALFFITGIDTGIGKSYITGLLGRYLIRQNKKVITAKLVQTGCHPISDDILLHRQLMEIPLSAYDQDQTTCAYVFSYPASPHLAARLENRSINPGLILEKIDKLRQEFEIILAEGAGGIYVPLNEQITILDLVASQKWPVIVVTSPRLGSLNHTFLTIEMLRAKKVTIQGLIYNLYPAEKKEITEDSRAMMQNRYPDLPIIEVPFLQANQLPSIDFSPLFRH